MADWLITLYLQAVLVVATLCWAVVDSSPAPFFGLLARLFSSPLSGHRDKKCDRGDRGCDDDYGHGYDDDDDCCRCKRDYDRLGQMLMERGGGKCNRRGGGKKCNRRHGKDCDNDHKPSYKPSWESYSQPSKPHSSPMYHYHYHVPSYTSHSYDQGGWTPGTSSYSSGYNSGYSSWRKQDTFQPSQKISYKRIGTPSTNLD